MENEKREEYLGDGVYAEFTGYSIILKANHHINPTDTIHIEYNTLESLLYFANRNDFYKIKE